MKKLLILVALTVGLLCGKSNARYLEVPSGPGASLHTSVYGGVQSTATYYSSSTVLCFTGAGSVVGFVASLNVFTTDYFIFRDTASLIPGATSGGTSASDDYQTSNPVFARVVPSTGITGMGQSVYFSFPQPIRVNKGLAVKPNTNGIQTFTVLYTKFGE